MEPPLTNEELRIAARQAVTLALTIMDEVARDSLLRRAHRLMEEADANGGQPAAQPH